MRKKLQVFISSTYRDLIEERQAAVEAILSSGHIPAGMELFKAGDESQLEAIKRWIDESDVYMLILGGRYGTIEPNSGKSYTHLEYEYALQMGMPVFAVVITDYALDQKVKANGRDMEEKENFHLYKTFRDIVLSKICNFFDDIKDIKLAIHQKMSEYQFRSDLSGWVSGTEVHHNFQSQADITKLQNKIQELENQIEIERGSIIQDTMFGEFTFSDVYSILTTHRFETGDSSFDTAMNIFDNHREVFAVGYMLNSNRPPTAASHTAVLLEKFGLVDKKYYTSIIDVYTTTMLGYKFLVRLDSGISK